jgi:hypothetical protein
MFIDELFGEGFYEKLPLGQASQPCFGYFFLTHAYYPHENLQIWRPIIDPNEPTKTSATAFQIALAGQDAFCRSLPLANPKLETNEEFLVIRAKRRPALLIQPECPWLGVDNKGFRGKVQRHLCLVAQIFGLADAKTGYAKFSPSFVDRVRRMEFPQLMFLPQKAGLFQVDSLLRLDEMQSVFTPNLEPLKFGLSKEVSEILRDQISFLLTGKGPNEYTELREMILKS